MKLGTENRKQVIVLAVLGGIAILSLGYQFLSSPSTPATAGAVASSGTSAARPAMRRTASGKMVPIAEPRLDPTLDFKPTPRGNGTTDHPGGLRMPPQPAPPPAINLKFFGFANKPGEPKRVFLSSQGSEDVFIAGEGDIVNRRYRVIRIMPNAVALEDVLYNNRQSIPLTQS